MYAGATTGSGLLKRVWTENRIRVEQLVYLHNSRVRCPDCTGSVQPGVKEQLDLRIPSLQRVEFCEGLVRKCVWSEGAPLRIRPKTRLSVEYLLP